MDPKQLVPAHFESVFDMESRNTTFPQHERSEAERGRGPQRMG